MAYGWWKEDREISFHFSPSKQRAHNLTGMYIIWGVYRSGADSSPTNYNGVVCRGGRTQSPVRAGQFSIVYYTMCHNISQLAAKRGNRLQSVVLLGEPSVDPEERGGGGGSASLGRIAFIDIDGGSSGTAERQECGIFMAGPFPVLS